MAKRSADEAGVNNKDVNGKDVFKSDGNRPYIWKSDFVNGHVFLFVITFTGYDNMFIFADSKKRIVFTTELFNSLIPRQIRIVSSKEDVSEVFDKATYSELSNIDNVKHMYEVIINECGKLVEFSGDANEYLESLPTRRDLLTPLQNHYLKQITAKMNKK